MINERKVESATPKFQSSGTELVEKLSFTHLGELTVIDDPLERAFYDAVATNEVFSLCADWPLVAAVVWPPRTAG